MPRLNVWLPDELATTVRSRLPDLNVSQALQAALAALLRCEHERAVCAACSTPVDVALLIDDALGRFYDDVMWRLGELIYTGVGTAEGCARIVKSVGERHRITKADTLPLPRPSRSVQRAAKAPDYFTARAARDAREAIS